MVPKMRVVNVLGEFLYMGRPNLGGHWSGSARPRGKDRQGSQEKERGKDE